MTFLRGPRVTEKRHIDAVVVVNVDHVKRVLTVCWDQTDNSGLNGRPQRRFACLCAYG